MHDKRLYSPNQIRDILEQHGFNFSKALGQNFLIDGNIVRKICDAAGVDENTNVLEIGPGIGTLTEELAMNAKKVVAIELDERLKPILEETLRDFENVNVIYGDCLKLDLKEIIEREFNGERISVVANLPYYVTTPILEKLFENDLPIDSITVMVQREVAMRMTAQAGAKDYSSLSVFVRFYSEPKIEFKVPNTVFMPKPKVDSAVVKMELNKSYDVDKELFFRIVKAAFSKRRKTIINALSSYEGIDKDKQSIKEILYIADIDENRRAEDLTIEEYINLTKIWDMSLKVGLLGKKRLY
ncbi:16S rRNA (adenine(1518)-N(6)/adenine(1519)-N(6))-dimethyltransferase RsmA [Soehngenia saccharolytica]|nr:16S rRNA (adenine(1518)-N(6)/adenine(1519)-N(6))-dimethyltransferase RsmA [Tissierellales bacterium]TJX68174.1 16S rRNA (adenine(1518)-N(6)/adenine(1519)-N(6))-dimethyltransferase RsmA [Soehngenia saccharolytica]